MDRRKWYLLGAIVLVVGCITSLYLAISIGRARAEGIFSAIRTDSPTNRFDRLRCPLLVNRNETFSIAATLLDPTTPHFDIVLEADGFHILSSARKDGSSPQKITWTWTIRAVENGIQTFTIQALSHKDLATPGIFHTWFTSYMEGCGIFVVNTPLGGKLILSLSLTCVILGAILIFPRLKDRVRDRRESSD
jgi:hypothetical protein